MESFSIEIFFFFILFLPFCHIFGRLLLSLTVRHDATGFQGYQCGNLGKGAKEHFFIRPSHSELKLPLMYKKKIKWNTGSDCKHSLLLNGLKRRTDKTWMSLSHQWKKKTKTSSLVGKKNVFSLLSSLALATVWFNIVALWRAMKQGPTSSVTLHKSSSCGNFFCIWQTHKSDLVRFNANDRRFVLLHYEILQKEGQLIAFYGRFPNKYRQLKKKKKVTAWMPGSIKTMLETRTIKESFEVEVKCLCYIQPVSLLF